MTDCSILQEPLAISSRNQSQAECKYLFRNIVIKLLGGAQVWEPTPHGRALGVAMAKMQHAFVGKSVIEIGTGTGIHAIAAVKLGARYVDVTDIEPEAVPLAQRNASLNGISLRNGWIRDWMSFTPPEQYDFVLCNPPFCKSGTKDRRSFISAMIRQSPKFLGPGGHLMFCQSSMANFALTEKELEESGFYYTTAHRTQELFREYYFEEPRFIEESRRVENGFEEVDGVFIETLRVFFCTLKAHQGTEPSVR